MTERMLNVTIKSGGVANKIMHIAQTRRKILKKKEKQWLSIALSAAMVVTGIPAAGIGTTVQAASGEAQVSVKNGEVTIGNEYLERKFSTSDNKLATTELDNKRADLTFTPAQGSEEFIIKLRQDGTTKLDGELDRTNWTVTASDQYNNEVACFFRLSYPRPFQAAKTAAVRILLHNRQGLAHTPGWQIGRASCRERV